MTSALVLTLADTWGMHGDIGAGWWIVMVLAMVVFWGGVILAGVWAVRRIAKGPSSHRSASALDILERRFAEGEVSVEDYRTRRDLLDQGDLSAPDGPAPAARSFTTDEARE